MKEGAMSVTDQRLDEYDMTHRYPQDVSFEVWYYVEPVGLALYDSHGSIGLITWKQVEAALRLHKKQREPHRD